MSDHVMLSSTFCVRLAAIAFVLGLLAPVAYSDQLAHADVPAAEASGGGERCDGQT